MERRTAKHVSRQALVYVLFTSALAGCRGEQPGGPTSGLRFEDIQCLPDVSAGESITEGQSLRCIFRLEGEPGRTASLSCEKGDSGPAYDCGAMAQTQLQPFGSSPLPIKDGLFIMPTAGRGGETINLTWVANDGKSQARHRIEFMVLPDNGLNAPPEIEINCGGDTSGSVSLAAGRQLACQVRLVDPDRDPLSWSYSVASGPALVNEPSPFGGAGQAPLEFTWRWDTVAADAGKSWNFNFSASDGEAPSVSKSLIVTVE